MQAYAERSPGVVFWLGLSLVVTAVVVAAVVGSLALYHAKACSGEPKKILWMLALHLLEAPVNVVVISGLFLVSSVVTPHPPILLITLPMVVLLVPALGVDFLEPAHRRIAWELLGLGAIRWSVTAATFTSFGSFGNIDRMLWMLCLGVLVLFGCAVRCAYTIKRLSTAGLSTGDGAPKVQGDARAH